MKIPDIKLNDGRSIPSIGWGTWQITDEAEYMTAFSKAMEVGYTHIDTAQAYHNEQYLGKAIKDFAIKRENLFITTKIAVQHFSKGKLASSFEGSLKNIDTPYVDLLLLHFPVSVLRKRAWHDLEEIKSSGQAKSIGVSNYTIRHLKELKTYSSVVPAVNQVELHVFLQQLDLIKYCQDNGIVVEAYSPLARGKKLDDSKITEIAKKYNKTYAQIMLRYLLELGLVILPKSATPKRIEENFNVFDFKLDKSDMETIRSLDTDMRTNWNPTHVP